MLITINQTVDYMAQGFMSFMRGIDIKWAIGRVGLKVKPVVGPEIARATASSIWAKKNVKAPHKTHKAQRHIINSLIGNFIQMRTEWMFQGPNTSRP